MPAGIVDRGATARRSQGLHWAAAIGAAAWGARLFPWIGGGTASDAECEHTTTIPHGVAIF